jgi:hypothetical protein
MKLLLEYAGTKPVFEATEKEAWAIKKKLMLLAKEALLAKKSIAWSLHNLDVTTSGKVTSATTTPTTALKGIT